MAASVQSVLAIEELENVQITPFSNADILKVQMSMSINKHSIIKIFLVFFFQYSEISSELKYKVNVFKKIMYYLSNDLLYDRYSDI